MESMGSGRETADRAAASRQHNLLLIVTSLLAILFASIHVVHDVALGFDDGGLSNLNLVLILVVWLCGTLVLAERRSGYVIVLVLSLLAAGVPALHMAGKSGMTAGIKESGEAFFFAWTLIALGVTAVFSVILAARGLWSSRRGQPREEA